ncbi:MAG: formylglycine-generating enzyme family protein [Chitinophagaceae bacterium]
MKFLVSFLTVFCVSLFAFGKATNAALPETKMVVVRAGNYYPFLIKKSDKPIPIAAFLMDETAVTNGEYLEFIKANPSWSKSKVSRLFADPNYLAQWEGDFNIGKEEKKLFNAPVVNVSWFAAQAYAKWKGKRLPTVAEWEMAGNGKPDKLKKHASLTEYILDWYNRPNTGDLPNVKSTYRNEYGLYDMHGLIWEWTFNFNSFISSGDSRTNTQDEAKLYCAAGALTVKDRKNYAAFLRFSFRGSLKGSYCISSLGFRCAKDLK